MADPILARQTQLANIEKRTGKSLAELCEILNGSGLTKHNELRAWAKERFDLGNGDANTLAHHARGYGSDTPEPDEVLDALYVGPKAALRPVHEAIVAAMADWGEYETAPKKGYVSLRRKKQFAMVGPATNTKVEIGLNVKGLTASERLVEQAPGGMCQVKVRLGDAAEVDEELLGWLRTAYESAG